MKYLFLYCLAYLSLAGISCSHYVGNPGDPNSVGVDNPIDETPSVFLQITARFEELDDRWAVTMRASSRQNGPEVQRIEGANLTVNGEVRDLRYGFPYRGTPEKLFLKASTSTLSLIYSSPTNSRSSASFTLGKQPGIAGKPLASKSQGLVVDIVPAIRMNETLVTRLYESSSGKSRLLKSATYDDVGRTSISFDKQDFAAVQLGDESLILQISRSTKAVRPALFSDGVEFYQVFAEFNRYIPVVE